MLQQTGNTNRDIDNIIIELNNIANGTTNINLLNIAAYGQIIINYPGNQTGTFTGSFRHGLGYIPIFIPKQLFKPGDAYNSIHTIIDDPLEEEYTFWNSGNQAQGVYSISREHVRADSNNLYVDLIVNAYTHGTQFYPPAGNYYYPYYIFSRPVTS